MWIAIDNYIINADHIESIKKAGSPISFTITMISGQTITVSILPDELTHAIDPNMRTSTVRKWEER